MGKRQPQKVAPLVALGNVIYAATTIAFLSVYIPNVTLIPVLFATNIAVIVFMTSFFVSVCWSEIEEHCFLPVDKDIPLEPVSSCLYIAPFQALCGL